MRTTESKEDEIDDITVSGWSEEEQAIFDKSSRLHFYLPFNGVEMQDSIEIDCEYIESLGVVQGYYYLRIPLLFYDWELKSSLLEEQKQDLKQEQKYQYMMPNINKTNFECRVKVHCRINHANSMTVQVMCCENIIQWSFFALLVLFFKFANVFFPL